MSLHKEVVQGKFRKKMTEKTLNYYKMNLGIDRLEVFWYPELKVKEFIKKFEEDILHFDLSKQEDLFIIGYNACLRDVLDKIKKHFGEELTK